MINDAGNVTLYAIVLCIIISMYGGGFATIPAWLADIFGTRMVGAIHGRLLTAWSAAGISGPVLVNYLRDWQLSIGVPPRQVYDMTLIVLSGLLVIGLLCTLLVRPVAEKYRIRETITLSGAAMPPAISWQAQPAPASLIIRWLMVGIPLLWGIGVTLRQATAFFH